MGAQAVARRQIDACTCSTPTTRHAETCRVAWEPNPGPQTRFVASRAHEVLYGGAAGGGKSDAIVALPLRWVDNKHFNALILRRTTKQLLDLIRKAAALYPRFGAKSKTSGDAVIWRFPSGATVWFNHCQHEDDTASYDGHEFQLVEFDELSHFSEGQYRKIRARIRSSHPSLPRYTRSTSNPPETPEGMWVFKRFAAWLDPAAKVAGLPARYDEKGNALPPAAPEQVLWFRTIEGSDEQEVVPDGTPGSLSRTFIPAKLSDNPHIGDEYVAQLSDLDPVRRAQLKDGNWLARASAGAFFQRGWFNFLEARPTDVIRWVRRWDFAATKPTAENKDPDWTRGVLMGRRPGGRYVIADGIGVREGPAGVEKTIKATAALDGRSVHIRLPQDPGSAGKIVLANYVAMLAGYVIGGEPETGDKVTRAGPLSAQVEAGNVDIVLGPWVDEFIRELEAFPAGGHDDYVDATSGAFNYLSPRSAAERFAILSEL